MTKKGMILSLGLLKNQHLLYTAKFKKHPGAAKIQHRAVYITVYNYADSPLSGQHHTF
jgi:hypothetical protein